MAFSQSQAQSWFFKFPPEVITKILDDGDYKSLQLFARTCRRARGFLTLVNTQRNSISIFLHVGYTIIIYVQNNEATEIHYWQKEDGCSVYEMKYGCKTKKLLKNKNMIEVAYNDLEFLLQYQKSELERLSINHNDWVPESSSRMYHDQLVYFHEKLQHYLSTRTKQLHVKCFEAYFRRNEWFPMTILPYLDPSTEQISISFQDGQTVLPMNGQVETEQWKNAKHINISNHVQMSIIHLTNVSVATISLERFTYADLIVLKNIFCKSPSRFDKFSITCRDSDYQKDRRIPQFGNPVKKDNLRTVWVLPTTSSSLFLKLSIERITSPIFTLQIVPNSIKSVLISLL